MDSVEQENEELRTQNGYLKDQMNMVMSKAISGIVVDEAGDLCAITFDGDIKNLGRIRGKDGKDGLNGEQGPQGIAGRDGLDGKDGLNGINGKDGLNYTDIKFELNEEFKSLTVVVDGPEGKKEAGIIFLPIPIYKGVYKEGSEYYKADEVTWAGSVWHCNAEVTKEKPGDGSKDWTLKVTKGRDGKEGPQGKQGPSGLNGKDGRDLTQLGPDGSKW